MVFKEQTWNKLNYLKSNIVGTFILQENKRVIEKFLFRNNNEYKTALSILQKYGFNNERKEPKKEVEDEIMALQREREKKEQEESKPEINPLENKGGYNIWA